jgi:hypothetical protein
MRLTLVDPKASLCHEWEKAFWQLPFVGVWHGVFQQIDWCDCLVSPANSYGLMDGGVDKIINEYFGGELQARVQRRIAALEEQLHLRDRPAVN